MNIYAINSRLFVKLKQVLWWNKKKIQQGFHQSSRKTGIVCNLLKFGISNENQTKKIVLYSSYSAWVGLIEIFKLSVFWELLTTFINAHHWSVKTCKDQVSFYWQNSLSFQVPTFEYAMTRCRSRTSPSPSRAAAGRTLTTFPSWSQIPSSAAGTGKA